MPLVDEKYAAACGNGSNFLRGWAGTRLKSHPRAHIYLQRTSSEWLYPVRACLDYDTAALDRRHRTPSGRTMQLSLRSSRRPAAGDAL